jgi:hypothetical protein
MFAFSASGLMFPLMMIHPFQRIPSEITKTVPDNWGVGRRPSGWMTAELLDEYTGHVSAPQLEKHNVKFSVILFINGHHTHLTYQLNELCSDLSILLISVYPNASSLFQPLDVATFRPQKIGWKTAVLERHRQNSDKILHEEWFTLSWMEL